MQAFLVKWVENNESGHFPSCMDSPPLSFLPQDFSESRERSAPGGVTGPRGDGAHPARRAHGGRSLQAAGAPRLRRMLLVNMKWTVYVWP